MSDRRNGIPKRVKTHKRKGNKSESHKPGASQPDLEVPPRRVEGTNLLLDRPAATGTTVPGMESYRTGPPTYYLPLSLIDGADYNPKNPGRPWLQRDHETSKHVQSLADSFSEVGQLNPVSLSRKEGGRFHTNDGHCRIAAARMKGWTEILAIVTNRDPAAVYRATQEGTKAHSANEKLMSFLVNPDSVGVYCRRAYQNMVDHVGKKLVKKLAVDGKSLATYKQALKVSAYCCRGDKPFVQQVLNWLIDLKQTFDVRKAMEAKMPPAMLMTVILKNEKVCYC